MAPGSSPHQGNEAHNVTDVNDKDDPFVYLSGFGNTLESEFLQGALPQGRNNPRQVPYGLYAEQLSGTAFTAPRASNRRTWLYRIQPSVVAVNLAEKDTSNEEETDPLIFGGLHPRDCGPRDTATVPLRWKPMPSSTSLLETTTTSTTTITIRKKKMDDFVSGMKLHCCSAYEAGSKNGLCIYMFAFTESMSSSLSETISSDGEQPLSQRYLYNADGDFLIVPQQGGALEIVTELGKLCVRPGEIVVIPRGIVFQVNRCRQSQKQQQSEEDAKEEDEMVRGYMVEIFGGSFQLPELGPIGANGLANARDFLHPTAWCVPDQDTYEKPCEILVKMGSYLYTRTSLHSPINVVAWHGNYLPYKYDLKRFCAVNSVTYDHIDPSIYTVLTCPTNTPGTALCDFVIFPPRVMATDSNTLRPPWFHRNTMSEYMGLIYGQYDAKQGFSPGGASLHNCMVPHGPDNDSYKKAVEDECAAPIYFDAGLAFMFETCLPLRVASQAMTDETWRDMEYASCWKGLDDQFTGWALLGLKEAEEEPMVMSSSRIDI